MYQKFIMFKREQKIWDERVNLDLNKFQQNHSVIMLKDRSNKQNTFKKSKTLIDNYGIDK